MALLTRRDKNLPEGVVELSETEAIAHQKSVLSKWPSKSEVFFLQNSCYIAGAAATITGAVTLSHLKKVLNIRPIVHRLIYLPAALVPGVFSCLSTEVGLTDKILLMKVNCAVCHQIKYATIQTFSGLIFPVVYGFTSMAMYAHFTKSYPFPDMTKNPKAVWKEYGRILMSGSKKYQYLGLLQAAIILLLPMMQAKEFENVTLKLRVDEETDDSDELLQA